MKEIKFRAWDTTHKKYIPWEKIKEMRILDVLTHNHNKKISNCILEQYTGFHDKNGTEIYEGDILLCSRVNLEYSDIVAVKYTPGEYVVYNPNCCVLCKNENGCIEPLTNRASFDILWSIRIIGNIHENLFLNKRER